MLALSMEDILLLVSKYYDILLASILVISVTALYLIPKVSTRAKDSKSCVPGNLGIPFVGETFALLSATNSVKGCYDFVRLRRERHGRWFKTRIFGKIHVFVPSVEGAKTIFTNDFALFNKGYVKSMADAVGKKSLLCVPQESHKRIRRLMSDPFSMNSLSKFVERFDNMLCERLKKVQMEEKSFTVLDFNMKLKHEMEHSPGPFDKFKINQTEKEDITFDAMCDMLMSIKDASLLEQIERDCTVVSDAMLSFPVMIPGTRYYKGIKARKRLMETFKKMITARRSGKDYHEDFLQSMLEKDSCPADQKLDDEEIMDNLLTMIIAGQTTTAATMMWSVKFLDEHREAQNRLREEQLSILRSKPNGALLALDDLNSMSYASKVVKETLRMSNVLLWFPRVALNDCSIEGFEIKKGWHANIDATCIHYDPTIYKHPMRFNPSRFDEMQKPYSYIPFGSGPRTCLGINMAKVTMLVFLYRLTSGYKWTVDDLDCSLERKAHIPRLRSGCPITLTALHDE